MLKRGIVKFFNPFKQFGFIKTDEGVEYFVYVDDIEHESQELFRDELVSFKPAKSRNGWQALEVIRLDPPHMDAEEGDVKSFDEKKGYGFIAREGKADAFMHVSDMIEDAGRKPKVGDRVCFKAHANMDGRTRAYYIRILPT